MRVQIQTLQNAKFLQTRITVGLSHRVLHGWLPVFAGGVIW